MNITNLLSNLKNKTLPQHAVPNFRPVWTNNVTRLNQQNLNTTMYNSIREFVDNSTDTVYGAGNSNTIDLIQLLPGVKVSDISTSEIHNLENDLTTKNDAPGQYQSVFGVGNKAHINGIGQFIVGRFANVDSTHLFVVGNGSEIKNNNAFTIDNEGNANLLGTFSAKSITLTTSPTTDNSATSKQYVDNLVETGLATKQDTLVSGTNIKTINGESLLGSGNIVIEGGGGGGSSITIDAEMSGTSTNPVQNKVIAGALYNKQDVITSATELTVKKMTVGSGDVQSMVTNGGFHALSGNNTTVVDGSTITFYFNGSTTPTGMIEHGNHLLDVGATGTDVLLRGVATPERNTDAANKSYADTKLASSTDKYNITWDTTTEALKITFN